MYRANCDAGFFDQQCAGPAEEDLLEEEMDEDEDPCLTTLQSIKAESDMMLDPVKNDPQSHFHDLENVPDQEQLKKLCLPIKEDEVMHAAEAESVADCQRVSALSEALVKGSNIFNGVIRLILRLRSEPGGSDLRFLPNPKGARKCAKKLNWHQWNEHVLAQQELETNDPISRQRASRLDKWKELSAAARQQLQLAPEGPDRLTYLVSNVQ